MCNCKLHGHSQKIQSRITGIGDKENKMKKLEELLFLQSLPGIGKAAIYSRYINLLPESEGIDSLSERCRSISDLGFKCIYKKAGNSSQDQKDPFFFAGIHPFDACILVYDLPQLLFVPGAKPCQVYDGAVILIDGSGSVRVFSVDSFRHQR